jgi:uncharacterized membrane protein
VIKHLHYVYLAYALPLMLLTARITPPFQIPDEPNHFCRAEQVSRFRWVTRPLPGTKVFLTDKGIEMASSFYAYLSFNPKARVQEELVPLSRNIRWNTGTVYLEFPNTAIYPPSGYLAPALGIWIGKLAHLPVIDTLYLSRWLNGLLCVLICFYALKTVRTPGPFFFAVLLLPMTVFLFSGVSQDGPLISLAFLFAAWVYDAESGMKKYSRRRLLLMVLCLAAICAAKPPYLLLGSLFFFLSLTRKEKLICFSAVFGLVAVWMLLNKVNYSIGWAPPELRVDAHLQVQHILAHPFRFLSLFFKINPSVVVSHVWWFIGFLGWEDVLFAGWFYKLSLLVLIAALLLSTRFNLRANGRLRLAIVLCLALSLIGIITAQYVTWMPLDSPYLGGVQSRYFIPLAPFLALAAGGFGESERRGRIWKIVEAGLLLFPLVTTVTLVETLIERYYW